MIGSCCQRWCMSSLGIYFWCVAGYTDERLVELTWECSTGQLIRCLPLHGHYWWWTLGGKAVAVSWSLCVGGCVWVYVCLCKLKLCAVWLKVGWKNQMLAWGIRDDWSLMREKKREREKEIDRSKEETVFSYIYKQLCVSKIRKHFESKLKVVVEDFSGRRLFG